MLESASQSNSSGHLFAGEGAAVRVANLTYTYKSPRSKRQGDTPVEAALTDVSFSIRAGELFAILGPNGSGKSTLFRILTTLQQPDSGSVDIFEINALTHPLQARMQLGVVFQSPSLDGKLSARENMVHQGRLYGLGGSLLQQRIDEALDYFQLRDRQNDPVEQFSGGMRRRIEIAKSILHRPRLLLMDEPSTGLDPGVRADLWRLLVQLRSELGMTVVLSTHLMDEADRCDRLAILARGRLVAIDTPAALKARIGGDVITLEPAAGLDATQVEALIEQIRQRFGPWPGHTGPQLSQGRIRMERPNGAAFVPQVAAQLGPQLASITVGQPTLEDVFEHLTGQSLEQ